jgi:23S rRNA (pseudouridine1915-N3)-methyltransferase
MTGFQGFSVHEVREGRGAGAEERRREEGPQILAALAAETLVCLDERGDDLSSGELAEWLRGRADAGTSGVAFAIGGADGLDPSVRQQAERTIAFGRATWPHQLVRIMLAEQLYRAMTILAGHPYHRGSERG